MFIEIIKQAIINHIILEISYDNDFSTRLIEPHTLGYNNKNNMVLSAYQNGGFSSSGNPVDWKLFDISKIKQIKQCNETFKIRREKGFNPFPSKKMFKNILQQIKD